MPGALGAADLDVGHRATLSSPAGNLRSGSTGPNGGYFNDGTHGPSRLTAYLTDGEHGPRVTDVPFGIATYRQAAAPAEVLGEPVAEREIEFAGRTWRLDETRAMDGTEQTFEVDTSDGDLLFAWAVRADDSRFVWHGELDPGDVRGGGSSGPRGPRTTDSGPGGILFAGDHYEIEARLLGKDPEGGAILIYRPE